MGMRADRQIPAKKEADKQLAYERLAGAIRIVSVPRSHR